MKLISAILAAAILLCACGESSPPAQTPQPPESPVIIPLPIPTADIPTPSPAPTPEPTQTPYPEIEISYLDTELVRIADFIPGAYIDLRYATTENFTGEEIYDFSDAYIRYGTLQKLIKVQDILSAQGYSLLIWDAYRPRQAQFALWEVVPDANFVANPYTGHSSHSNGGTLDLSLVLSDGSVVEMPSAFDEFNALADRNYGDVSPVAAANAAILEQAMYAAGFCGYWNEWWHYSDSAVYPYEDVETITLPSVFSRFYTADCNEFINLRSHPDYSAASIAQIPAEAEMKFLAWCGEFAHVQYGSLHGYVAADYIKPVITEE